MLPLAAQRGTVKGRVWNARNNEALIGAVVRMEGTKRATVTDSVGNYVFKMWHPASTISPSNSWDLRTSARKSSKSWATKPRLWM